MKELPIFEDDKGLFGSVLTAEEYMYYEEHKEAIRCMWKEQGHPFWLNTIIKFRIYAVKHGCLSPFNDNITNGALDYPFIKIAEKMTGMFGDVTEFLTDVSIVTRNMHLAENMLKPTCVYDPFINLTTRNSFRNLFGPPDNKIRILRTYIFAEIFCAWGGAFVRLLPSWVVAPKVRPAPGLWSPPPSYTRPSPLRTGLFEQYLKKNWIDDISAVCGAPPEQLIWWSSVPPDGATALPPMEEFNTLTQVFQQLVSSAETRAASNTASNTAAATKTAKVKKAGVLPLPLPPQPAKTDKKKKRKKKSAKSDKQRTGDTDRPKPVVTVPEDESDRFPRPAPEVVSATLEWHEYATAQLGSGQLLRSQVLGGAIYFGWMVLLIEDCIPRMAHTDPSLMTNVRSKCNSAKEFRDTAKFTLAMKGNAVTVALRKERDELSAQIKIVRQVVEAVCVLRVSPGTDHAAELGRVRTLVKQALGNVILRLYPAVFQYSVTEAVSGDPRHVYPDFSRTRYLLRKGLALVSSPVPQDTKTLERSLMAALDWYTDLVRLPEQLWAHVRTQLRPGGVLAGRLAQPEPYRTDSEKQLEALDLAKPETFAALERVFREVREMSGGDSGPVPPRPAALRPHTGQSLVDAYWSRLGAMAFVTDLLCVIPVTQMVRNAIASFKQDHLNALFDAVTSLQIAQWRWLYPRTELELPKRPAFSQAASADLLTRYLNHADVVMRDTHLRLRRLYQVVMDTLKCNGKCSAQKQLWHMVHFYGDACQSAGTGTPDRGDCKDCRQHSLDVANQRILRAVSLLIRLEVKCGVDFEKIVENFHVVPSFLVAIQDYKAHPTKSASVAIEKLFDDVVNVTKSPGNFDVLHRAVRDIAGPGLNNRYPSPRQLGYREASTREFMLSACQELAKRIVVHVHKAELPMDWDGCLKTLRMAGDMLVLTDPGGDLPAVVIPGPPAQRLDLSHHWPALMATADAKVGDWRSWVEAPQEAANALAGPGRPPLDAASTAACVCRPGSGSGSVAPLRPLRRDVCTHTGPARLLCTVLQTLRNIRFVEQVTVALGAGADITVHMTMLNVLREGWLPYVLAADRVFSRHTDLDVTQRVHFAVIESADPWLDQVLTELYRPRQKIGPGRMLRSDRSWLLGDSALRPDITVCRTISWSQACDLHMDIMKRLMTTLWYTRTVVPPVEQDGCEVHPAPLALLERVEAGAVLLLCAFLEYRDGRCGRHLVDVSQLGPEVALALDLHGWLAAVDSVVRRVATVEGHPPEPSDVLRDRTERALTLYERPLRDGSLLEFLALRQSHAEPLRWAVRAHLQRSGPTHDTLLSLIERGHPPLTLPPIAELRSQAMRDRRLPFEWKVRLQQLRRVLSAPQPQLLDATLVSLDYKLVYGQLPDMPTFDGAPGVSGKDMFSVERIDAEALCNHVFDLGAYVLKMQTYGKTYHSRTQDDHIMPDRCFFMKAFGVGRFGMLRSAIEWAAANVEKQLLPGRPLPPELRGPTNSATNGTQGEGPTEIQPAAIDSLARQLESLLLTDDYLSDIPEEPLEPEVLETAGRYAAELAGGVQRLPDGALKRSSRQLVTSVQQAVTPQTQRGGRGKARPIAGSEMSVVDTCLSVLASVLCQHGMTVTKPTPVPPTAAAAALRVCSFCDRREEAAGAFELCSLCVTGCEAEPRAYCGKPCQTDDWEMGHWEDHN